MLHFARLRAARSIACYDLTRSCGFSTTCTSRTVSLRPTDCILMNSTFIVTCIFHDGEVDMLSLVITSLQKQENDPKH